MSSLPIWTKFLYALILLLLTVISKNKQSPDVLNLSARHRNVLLIKTVHFLTPLFIIIICPSPSKNNLQSLRQLLNRRPDQHEMTTLRFRHLQKFTFVFGAAIFNGDFFVSGRFRVPVVTQKL
jgi:hypothetical protein